MLLENTDRFLTQVTEEPTIRHSVLDLIVTKKEGLLGDMKVTGSLKCSDPGGIHNTNRREKGKQTR